jgi:hypothetical protein
MKIIRNFKNFIDDFILFFKKEFFKDNYRNEFVYKKNQEKFLSKYLRSKKKQMINIRNNDNTISEMLKNVSTSSSILKKTN